MAKVELTTDLYMGLMSAERTLSELPAIYDKAEECGIDCQNLREVRDLFIQRSEALRRNFGPGSAKRPLSSDS